jgi:hypothetical protein
MAVRNLGLVGVKSVHGRYLQAHSDNGQLHASNEHRNEEETWFLIEVDQAQHYALCNWSNGKFMSKQGGPCAPANSTVLSDRETWRLISGVPYGVLNAVCIQSKADGKNLGDGTGPDHDSECGGEVSAHDGGPPSRDPAWPGWWVFESATPPPPGRDLWNTVGNAVAGVVNKISAADVAALITVLAAA